MPDTKISAMTAGNPAQGTDAFHAARSGADYKLTVDDISARNLPHQRYHFHGYAGDQILGDGKFLDRSALQNHAVRGVNLTDAQAFANAGYVSTIDPAAGVTDSVLRIPSINFDYNAGEKLIAYWLGKGTAEGTNVQWIGDGESATYPGWAVRCTATTGTMQPLIRDASAAYFAGTTTGAVMNGSLNSFAFVLDGQNKKVCCWVNESLDTAYAAGYLTFNGGNPADSRTSNTVQVGTAFPAAAVSTSGMVVQTRALHILRLSASDVMPTAAAMTALFKQIRANPGKPLLGSAF